MHARRSRTVRALATFLPLLLVAACGGADNDLDPDHDSSARAYKIESATLGQTRYYLGKGIEVRVAE